MNTKKLFFLSLIFFSGVIFYCFYNNIIIIRFPNKFNFENVKKPSHKKVANFFFFQDNKYIQEDAQIIVSESMAENINNILVSWLAINYDFEKEYDKGAKQITVQSVMLDSENNFAYISLDKNPLNKQWSMYQKIKFIESILKTVNENKIKIQGIYFLVNHRFLEDAHLDFSHSWPITGYSEVN